MLEGYLYIVYLHLESFTIFGVFYDIDGVQFELLLILARCFRISSTIHWVAGLYTVFFFFFIIAKAGS